MILKDVFDLHNQTNIYTIEDDEGVFCSAGSIQTDFYFALVQLLSQILVVVKVLEAVDSIQKWRSSWLKHNTSNLNVLHLLNRNGNFE